MHEMRFLFDKIAAEVGWRHQHRFQLRSPPISPFLHIDGRSTFGCKIIHRLFLNWKCDIFPSLRSNHRENVIWEADPMKTFVFLFKIRVLEIGSHDDIVMSFCQKTFS